MNDHFSVQQALYAALVGANICDGRVYDHVPQESQFPYVRIGEMTAVTSDVQCHNGSEEFVDLHVWARDKRGQKETKDIMSAMHDVLHVQDIPVAGKQSALFEVVSQRTLLDPDGVTYHGILTVRIETYEQ